LLALRICLDPTATTLRAAAPDLGRPQYPDHERAQAFGRYRAYRTTRRRPGIFRNSRPRPSGSTIGSSRRRFQDKLNPTVGLHKSEASDRSEARNRARYIRPPGLRNRYCHGSRSCQSGPGGGSSRCFLTASSLSIACLAWATAPEWLLSWPDLAMVGRQVTAIGMGSLVSSSSEDFLLRWHRRGKESSLPSRANSPARISCEIRVNNSCNRCRRLAAAIKLRAIRTDRSDRIPEFPVLDFAIPVTSKYFPC
jgi:hypothetical protein